MLLMLSVPPATTMSFCPVIMDWAPTITAFMPEAHTLFTNVHGTLNPRPAPAATCVAGASPRAAGKTLPKNSSCTSDGLTPARASAPFTARLPSSMADRDERLPPKLPIGVRTAERTTTSFIGCDLCVQGDSYRSASFYQSGLVRSLGWVALRLFC